MVNPQNPVASPVVPPPPLVVPTSPVAQHGSSNTLLGMLQQQQQQMTLLQQQMTLLQQQLSAQQEIIIELQQQQQPSKPSNYFLELKEAHAPTFAGSTDPLEVEKWITEMEKFCQDLCIPKDEWVNVTIPFLIADAEAWFISVRSTYESEGERIDWELFRKIFFLKYLPYTFIIEKQNNFFNLKQGSLTVIQYATMFDQLGRFVCMVNEQNKVTRFQERLNLNLRKHMGTRQATTYEEVLEQALQAERLVTEKNQIRDSKRPRPCNEQYEETEAAANKKAASANMKAIQEDLADSSVDGQYIEYFRFISLDNPHEEELWVERSKLNSYDEMVESVAQHISLDDPSKIRLTAHNCVTQKPNPQPIKYRGLEHFIDILRISDILYYEVLDIPLPELESLKILKVAFHYATKDEEVSHTIRLAKQSTVGDVINHLKTKVELSHPNAKLRLLKISYHKIYEIFSLEEKIEKIDEVWELRAEEIPEEEETLGPHDRLIHVFHFMEDSSQYQVIQIFGEPFLLAIHKGETLAKVKSRIQKKLQVSDEEFSKWKFGFVSMGHPEYLQDSDIVISFFQKVDVESVGEPYIGLKHSDNTPKRSYA